MEVRRYLPGRWYMLCRECEGIGPDEPLYDWAETWEEAMALARVHLLERHTEGRVIPELLATMERVLGHVHNALGIDPGQERSSEERWQRFIAERIQMGRAHG